METWKQAAQLKGAPCKELLYLEPLQELPTRIALQGDPDNAISYKGWDNHKGSPMLGTLDGQYQEPWGATVTRLRPMEAIILGHYLGKQSRQTKPV